MPQQHRSEIRRLCDNAQRQLRRDGWRERVGARMRVVLEGIEEGLRNPKTRASVEVLYEDHLPVRLCLRMVFRMVGEVLREAR